MQIHDMLWHDLRILDLKLANLKLSRTVEEDDSEFNYRHQELLIERGLLIEQFERTVGYNPDNLCRIARKQPIEYGDVIFSTYHKEWVKVMDVSPNDALCLFQTGQHQAVPKTYLQSQ